MIINELMSEINPNTFIEDYLHIKGIKNIKGYLHPNISYMDNPSGYAHMKKAASTLMKYKDTQYKVDILVDCDCDGLFSSAIMINFCINQLNIVPNIILHKNNGLKKHGLTDMEVMNTLEHDTPKLLIIPDAGSNDIDQCKKLKTIGIEDILILDHHAINQNNPYAIVVNNQSKYNKNIKNKNLSGTGVTYKMIEYICQNYNISLPYYLDLVAFSILSDVCNLTSLENRYIVKEGLNNIQNIFLQKLIQNFIGIQITNLTPEKIVWNIIPKLNAMMRFNNTLLKTQVVNLLSNYNISSIDLDQVIKELKSSHRQQAQITKTWSNKIVPNLDKNAKVVMVSGDDCEATFTGLIAGNIADITKKPTLITKDSGDTYTGSVRTNNLQFFDLCKKSKLFNFVAGHKQAFGFEFNKNKENEIHDFFNSLDLSQETEYNVVKIFNTTQIPRNLFHIGEEYETLWGEGIEYPMFGITNIKIKGNDIMELGKNKTTVSFKYKNLNFIKFFCSKLIKEQLHVGENIDLELTIIGKLMINRFNNILTPQVQIQYFDAKVVNNNDIDKGWESIF